MMYELDEMNMLPPQVSYIDTLVDDAGYESDDDFSYIYKQNSKGSPSTVGNRTSIGSPGGTKFEPAFNMFRILKVEDYCALINALLGFSSILNSFKFTLNGEFAHFQRTYLSVLLATLLNLLNAKWGRSGVVRSGGAKLSDELNSLASLVTFVASPVVMAFTLGLQTTMDVVVLSFFLLCGIARLARCNILAHQKGFSGHTTGFMCSTPLYKPYSEGLPVSSSLILVATMNLMAKKRLVHGALPLGLFCKVQGLEFHPITLVFLLCGCGLVSKRLKIPVF